MHTMTSVTPPVSSPSRHAGQFADPLQMQHRLFVELSAMFGREVPLYEQSLHVNRLCNRAVCTLLGSLFPGLAVSDEQLDKTSGERHGAIRIGRPDEYRLIARFFAAFAMQPHSFYDMTSVGAKSQPIVATAFRSRINPEHRVFTSLLMTDCFDAPTRARIESLLASRRVFSDLAIALLDKNERQGGLSWTDATALIAEGTQRIFKWTGGARDHALYQSLCDSGLKIAADIACFESHHLNHLTPNTLCMDLYTAAMKHGLGELTHDEFVARATHALDNLAASADRHWLALHFHHLSATQLDGTPPRRPAPTAAIPALVASLATDIDALGLDTTDHAGFKDTTEGPPANTPVLLRQDSYKALTEPVLFTNTDGSTINTVHTARFGEIEQRFYATTPKGRALYDTCLAAVDALREQDDAHPEGTGDFLAMEARYARPFAPFPNTLPELLSAGLVYGRYAPCPTRPPGKPPTSDIRELVRLGFARVEGLRYEDFLPVSAAGIFASNLDQQGTAGDLRTKHTQPMLEAIIGRPIIDIDADYAAIESQSITETLAALGV